MVIDRCYITSTVTDYAVDDMRIRGGPSYRNTRLGGHSQFNTGNKGGECCDRNCIAASSWRAGSPSDHAIRPNNRRKARRLRP